MSRAIDKRRQVGVVAAAVGHSPVGDVAAGDGEVHAAGRACPARNEAFPRVRPDPGRTHDRLIRVEKRDVRSCPQRLRIASCRKRAHCPFCNVLRERVSFPRPQPARHDTPSRDRHGCLREASLRCRLPSGTRAKSCSGRPGMIRFPSLNRPAGMPRPPVLRPGQRLRRSAAHRNLERCCVRRSSPGSYQGPTRHNGEAETQITSHNSTSGAPTLTNVPASPGSRARSPIRESYEETC